jgi:hypothetical protein
MTYELPNINNIIITKSFEYFDNADDENIAMQLDILEQVKLEYIKLLENNKNDIINSDILYIDDNMSSNKWVEHVKAYAKQHGLSYMCAATDPNCSKSYKEGKTPTTKTKAITASVVAKTENKSSSSSSTNGNTFKEVDKSYISKSKAPFYIYKPFDFWLYKITKIRTSQYGFVYYTAEVHNRTSIETIDKNNVKYAVAKFDSKVAETVERNAPTFFSQFEGYKTLIFNSFNFNKPLIVRQNIAPKL